MTSLPASGYWGSSSRKGPDGPVIAEQVRSVIAELPGGGAESTLTIASGVMAPGANAARIFSIETEGGASADDLTNVDLDEVPDGALILFRCANASHVVTAKQAAGGDGQFNLRDSRDCVLDSTSKWLLCVRQSLIILEIARFGFRRTQLDVLIKTGNYTILPADTGALFTNRGASATVTLTLPACEAGLVIDVLTDAAQRIKLQAVGDDVISDGASDSSTAGFIQCAASKGESVRLLGLTSAVWRVDRKNGTWTIDS